MNYFKENDFKCKCGCGMDVSQELKDKLNKARELAGIPFIVNSGARCAKHNANINASPTSSHIKGIACDLRAINSTEYYVIIKALMDVGFKRIGINFNKSFIHCDLDDTKVKPCIFKY